jgi:hypothetical protein
MFLRTGTATVPVQNGRLFQKKITESLGHIRMTAIVKIPMLLALLVGKGKRWSQGPMKRIRPGLRTKGLSLLEHRTGRGRHPSLTQHKLMRELCRRPTSKNPPVIGKLTVGIIDRRLLLLLHLRSLQKKRMAAPKVRR